MIVLAPRYKYSSLHIQLIKILFNAVLAIFCAIFLGITGEKLYSDSLQKRSYFRELRTITIFFFLRASASVAQNYFNKQLSFVAFDFFFVRL